MFTSVRKMTAGSALALALASLVSTGAQAQDLRTVAALLAPPDMISAYTCATYASAVFTPEIQTRAAAQLKDSKNRAAVLRKILQDYDDQVASMCRELLPLFLKQPELVSDAFARQVPGYVKDSEPDLANPRVQRWARETADFQARTTSLVDLYKLMHAVAPELSGYPPADAPDMAEFAGAEEASTFRIVGKMERMSLIEALGDPGFAGVAPRRFHLADLAKEEKRLRQEAVALHAAMLLPYPKNATLLTLLHFLSFDVMSSIGMMPVIKPYYESIKGAGRQ